MSQAETLADAKSQAEAQLASILEYVEAYDNAETDLEREDAERAIREDPLSVEIRSQWASPGETFVPDEFRILLCTGGPAVRIVGDLGAHSEPETVSIEYQGWFTPWTELRLTAEQTEAVKRYCSFFYYGE